MLVLEFVYSISLSIHPILHSSRTPLHTHPYKKSRPPHRIIKEWELTHYIQPWNTRGRESMKPSFRMGHPKKKKKKKTNGASKTPPRLHKLVGDWTINSGLARDPSIDTWDNAWYFSVLPSDCLTSWLPASPSSSHPVFFFSPLDVVLFSVLIIVSLAACVDALRSCLPSSYHLICWCCCCCCSISLLFHLYT